MSAADSKRWLTSAVLLAFVVRAVHLVAIARSAIPGWQVHIHQTDFYVTWAWAEQIRAGDWLGRATFHPLTAWMQSLGTPEDWSRWWGGFATFQQAPLYAYLVALVCAPPRGSPVSIFIIQSVLSVACVPMVFALANRWSGPVAGVAAAFFWALARTEVALDSFLLRDALALPLILGGLCLLERLRETPRPYRVALGAGLLLGLATLQRENILVLLFGAVPAAAWIVAKGQPFRPSRMHRAAVAATLFAGGAIALCPLVARNVAVGAPPFALSNRGPEAILAGLSLSPSANPIGFHTFPAMRSQLEEAHASSLGALKIIFREAKAAPAAFGRLLAKKAWAWLSAGEPTDNVDLDFLILRSPVLRLCVPSLLILAPAALGFILLLRRPEQSLVALGGLVILLAPLLLGSVLWRLRVGLLPILVPLAGVGVAWLWQADRRRAGAAGTVLAAWIALAYLFPVGPLFRMGSMGATLSAAVYLSDGNPKAALSEVDEFLSFVAEGKAEPFSSLGELRQEILEDIDAQERKSVSGESP